MIEAFEFEGFSIEPDPNETDIRIRHIKGCELIRLPISLLKEIVAKLHSSTFFVLHYSSGCIESSGPFANTDTAREHARGLYDSNEYEEESDSLHLLSNTNGEIDITDYSESELLEAVGDDDEG